MLETNSVEYILVKCEGDANSTFEVNIDEDKELNLQAFQTLAVAQRNPMIGNGISSRSQYAYYQYKYNFCVVFDLITSTIAESFVLPKRGQAKLDLKLKSNVNSITCIALGQTDSIIQIGKDFEIYTDINII
jgi:hypothetical protein